MLSAARILARSLVFLLSGNWCSMVASTPYPVRTCWPKWTCLIPPTATCASACVGTQCRTTHPQQRCANCHLRCMAMLLQVGGVQPNCPRLTALLDPCRSHCHALHPSEEESSESLWRPSHSLSLSRVAASSLVPEDLSPELHHHHHHHHQHNDFHQHQHDLNCNLRRLAVLL